MSLQRKIKAYFFAITDVLRSDGTQGGVRLNKFDKPTKQTYIELLDSVAFIKESSDRAKVYTGSIDVGDEQGLAVLATDAQAKANDAQLTDRSLVTQPHQLPTVESTANVTAEDMPSTNLTIAPDPGTATRNRYLFNFNTTWVAWLISRIFKAGGSTNYVPTKVDGTDYNWTWQDPSTNALIQTYVNTQVTNAVNTAISSLTTSFTTLMDNNEPIGVVKAYAGAGLPVGSNYLMCDGSVVLQASYPDLFALIGATYNTGGENGGTEFRLPNLKGRQITGFDSGDAEYALGTYSATGKTRLIADINLPVASPYGITDPGHTHTADAGGTEGGTGDNIIGDGGCGTHGLDNLNTIFINVDSNTTGITISDNVGGDTPLDIRDEYVAMNYIIKAL